MDEDKNISFKDVDPNKATKIMRQYLEIKNEHPDDIVFFRIGDFYETYFEDARLFSQICDVTLTGKKFLEIGTIPMAGVPIKSIDIYIKKLLDKNARIVRCEQIKDENGDFIRKAVRIYTKGTIYENEFLEPDKNNYLCAVSKFGEKYGFAYCEVSEGKFYLTSGSKDEIAQEIVKISPKEILINKEELLFEFRNCITDYKSVVKAAEYFKAHFLEIKYGEFEEGYICANAILNYLLEVQKEYSPKLEDIEKYSVSSFMAMDFNTRRALELSRTQADFKKRGSLFWFLNKTKTSMGARTLRNWINAPLCDYKSVMKRRRLVEELYRNPLLMKNTEDFLNDFCDLLRLSSKISNKTICIKELLAVAKSLEKVSKINEIARSFNSSLLDYDEENAQILYDFSNILKRTLDEDNPGSVKEGANAQLDYFKNELKTLEKQLKKLEKEQIELSGSDATFVSSSAALGYYFEARPSKFNSLDCEIIIKQKLKNAVRYTTKELIVLEEKLNAQNFSILELEKEIIKNLKEYSKELTAKIRQFAKSVAYLDAIYSLCVVALENGFCAPKFNEDGLFEVKDGQHPCVKAIFGSFIPNDTHLNSNKVFLNVLTGANMSGKSTYLKQNAIIAILAQIGSFVPANKADMPLFDRISLHSSICDNLSEGVSTFMAEIQNLAYIINSSTKNSLILLDEAIKGTNPDDASCLYLALLEYIAENIRAKTIAVTHFASVSKIEQKCSSAEIFSIGDDEPRKIKHGISKNSRAYETALSAGLPESIIEKAKSYSL